MRMVSDSEVALDHVANPRQGPALGLEAGMQRPLLEDLEESLPLRGRQPRRPARLGASLQRREPAGIVPQSLGPLADRHPADTQSTSDLGLRETAGTEQAGRFQPPLFELFGGESSRSPHPYDRTTIRKLVKRLT
jgi:hypothetical protein